MLQVLEAEAFEYIICGITLRVSIVDPREGLGCADDGTADIGSVWARMVILRLLGRRCAVMT